MQAPGDLVDKTRTRTVAAPSLGVSAEVNPGGVVEISVRGRAEERFILLAAPDLGPMKLGNFPLPVDLGPSETELVLAVDGTLDSSGRTRRKLEVPDDPSLPGKTLYWQALLFSAQGVAKTNSAQTFVWERA